MKTLFATLSVVLCSLPAWSQTQVPAVAVQDSSEIRNDIYGRPTFATLGKISLGGFVDANTNSFVQDGSPEGFSFEMRHFNVFLSSHVSERLLFLSEVEFEHGSQNVFLKRAQLDFEFHPAFVVRGGVILPPIGNFNVNNDSPKWEFINRPLVSTEIIPSTLSEVGFGIHGMISPASKMSILYGGYLTNGLSDRVVLNEFGRTRLASGKNANQFAADNNGSPAISGRLAVRQNEIGELGLSYYEGVYNTYRIGGETVDEKRRLHIFAVDYRIDARIAEIKGELAYALINLQKNLQETFGDQQSGGYADIIIPVWRPNFFDYDDAVWNLNFRLERVDYNMGRFSSTGNKIYDETNSVTGGISFRPTPATVFRFNYMRSWHKDLFGNPASKTAGVQLGFATYF